MPQPESGFPSRGLPTSGSIACSTKTTEQCYLGYGHAEGDIEGAIGDGAGPCPLMAFHDGRFRCGLVETEKAAGMEPLIAKALGIGSGCPIEWPQFGP